MRLHVPIYAVSVLAPEYKRWIYGPRPALFSLVVRYLRTCCCLTMLYEIPLGVSCLSWSDRHRATVRMAGALTTLAFLLEHKHRRGSVMKTMGVYVTGALAARAVAALAIPPKTVKVSQLVLLTVAMAVLFQDVTPDSSRMARMLFGYSHKPALVDDERTDITARKGDKTTGAKELDYRAEVDG
uniref:Uncharacterized protein n=1 Tax=Hyaloperonospora arabidopsidis (strain Emoy2) TaxID=559515 RepID=M4B3R8_HYAAE